MLPAARSSSASCSRCSSSLVRLPGDVRYQAHLSKVVSAFPTSHSAVCRQQHHLTPARVDVSSIAILWSSTSPRSSLHAAFGFIGLVVDAGTSVLLSNASAISASASPLLNMLSNSSIVSTNASPLSSDSFLATFLASACKSFNLNGAILFLLVSASKESAAF